MEAWLCPHHRLGKAVARGPAGAGARSLLRRHGPGTSCAGPGAAQAAARLGAVAAAVIAFLRAGSSRAAIPAGMPALRAMTGLPPG